MRLTRWSLMIAVIGLALLGASCSSGDDEGAFSDVEPESLSEVMAVLAGSEWSGFEVKVPVRPGVDSELVSVEYREDPVEVSGFVHDSDPDSFIEDIWYDFRGQYLIVSLEGVNYHYCSVPMPTYMNWTDLELAEEALRDPLPSMGPDHRELFYLEHIKGDFDCQTGPIPEYDSDGAVAGAIVEETTTTTTTTTLPPVEWPQAPETWMILATQDYLADWSEALDEMMFEDEYLEVGDLTAMGRFWLERDRHPSLACTEDEIRQILGSTHSDFDLPYRPRTTMVADVESMQVIGYEPGPGFLLTYERDIVDVFDDGEEFVRGPNISYVFVDSDLGKAFGAYTDC